MPETTTHTAPPVKEIRDSLQQLVLERQQLRNNGADLDSLEDNRRTIVERQWELSRALIARHAA